MNTHVLRTADERPFALVLMVLVLFAATAFAGAMIIGDDDAATGGGPPAAEPAVPVSEALEARGGVPMLVSGLLFVTGDGSVYLTDTMAESYPPQIDLARSLRIEGLDLATVAGLHQAGGVAWTDGLVELSGTVSVGTMTVGG